MNLIEINKPNQEFWDEFDQLSKACLINNVQLKSAWLKPYIKHQLIGDIYILAVYKGVDLVGCLPMQLNYKKATKYWNYRVLNMLGSGPTDFFDILVQEDYKEEVLGILIDYLKKNRNWDYLNLSLLEPDDFLFKKLKSSFSLKKYNLKKQVKTGYNYEHTDEYSWADYYSNTFKTKNKDLRKGERRLKNDNITYDVKIYKKDIFKHFMSVVSLYADRRQTLGQYNFYENKKYRAFLKDVVSNYEKFSGIEFSTLVNSKGVTLAMQLDFINKNIRYHWNHAYNEDYKRYSPGKILLKEILKKSFEDENIKVCNHMRGLSSYKTKFTSHQKQLTSLNIVRVYSIRVIATKLVSSLLKLVK